MKTAQVDWWIYTSILRQVRLQRWDVRFVTFTKARAASVYTALGCSECFPRDYETLHTVVAYCRVFVCVMLTKVFISD